MDYCSIGTFSSVQIHLSIQIQSFMKMCVLIDAGLTHNSLIHSAEPAYQPEAAHLCPPQYCGSPTFPHLHGSHVHVSWPGSGPLESSPGVLISCLDSVSLPAHPSVHLLDCSGPLSSDVSGSDDWEPREERAGTRAREVKGLLHRGWISPKSSLQRLGG